MISLKQMVVVFLAVMLVLWAMAGITSIEPGEVGLRVKMIGDDKGMQQDTLDTGVHWNEVFTYDIPVYDTKYQQYNLQAIETQTKDGQPVLVDVSLEIGLIDELVPWIHEHIGYDYWERVLYPALRSSIRSQVPSELSDNVYTSEGRKLIQQKITDELHGKFEDKGFDITVNLRDINFTNQAFIGTLERKAMAAQTVIIEKRNAEAAEQIAIKVANIAEGNKQKAIKESEAEREKRRLEGEGFELQKKAEARGNLAVYKSEAEGIRLKASALKGTGSDALVSMEWAKHLGANVKVLGYPLGAPGTTGLFNVNGILGDALKIKGGK